MGGSALSERAPELVLSIQHGPTLPLVLQVNPPRRKLVVLLQPDSPQY